MVAGVSLVVPLVRSPDSLETAVSKLDAIPLARDKLKFARSFWEGVDSVSVGDPLLSRASLSDGEEYLAVEAFAHGDDRFLEIVESIANRYSAEQRRDNPASMYLPYHAKKLLDDRR